MNRPILALLLSLCAGPAFGEDAKEPPASRGAPTATGSTAPDATPPTADSDLPRPLDLTLRYDPLPVGEDAAWGAIRVTASIESTQLFLDGVPIGTGSALRDRVAPGLHVLEARLPSGRSVVTNLLVRPGALVETTLRFGDQKGEEAYSVVMNVLSIAASTLMGSAMAVQGNTPVQTAIPGLIRAGAVMASGNRDLPRP